LLHFILITAFALEISIRLHRKGEEKNRFADFGVFPFFLSFWLTHFPVFILIPPFQTHLIALQKSHSQAAMPIDRNKRNFWDSSEECKEYVLGLFRGLSPLHPLLSVKPSPHHFHELNAFHMQRLTFFERRARHMLLDDA